MFGPILDNRTASETRSSAFVATASTAMGPSKKEAIPLTISSYFRPVFAILFGFVAMP